MQAVINMAINMDNSGLATTEIETILKNIEGVKVISTEITDEIPLQNEDDWFDDSRFEIEAIIEVSASKWEKVKKSLEETPEYEGITDTARQWNITYDYCQCELITAENEQEALDTLIDKLEAEGANLYVKPIDEVEGIINEDMYVIGGNHGLALVHNGLLNIEEA